MTLFILNHTLEAVCIMLVIALAASSSHLSAWCGCTHAGRIVCQRIGYVWEGSQRELKKNVRDLNGIDGLTRGRGGNRPVREDI